MVWLASVFWLFTTQICFAKSSLPTEKLLKNCQKSRPDRHAMLCYVMVGWSHIQKKAVGHSLTYNTQKSVRF